MIFDSHAHYDDEQFDEDRDTLLSGMEEAGIGGIINMGASLEGVAASQALAEQYPREITKDWEELNALFLAALEM